MLRAARFRRIRMRNGSMLSDERIKFRNIIFDYARETYGTEPEYLWEKTPDTAVLRHSSNKKWYAAVLDVRRDKLGLKGDGVVDILDVKCDPMLIGSLIEKDGYCRAYHMNKEKWITIILDGTVPNEEIFGLIDLSYELTDVKRKKKRSDT